MKVSPEILTEYPSTIADEILQIIVFEAVGCNFGVDIIQIVEILPLEEAKDRHVNIIRLEDRVNVSGHIIHYRSPKVLVVKEEETNGILINEPQDIIDVNPDHIHPLPPLIAKLNRESSIWGASFLDDVAIYLIDCYQLLENYA